MTYFLFNKTTNTYVEGEFDSKESANTAGLELKRNTQDDIWVRQHVKVVLTGAAAEKVKELTNK